MVPTPGGIDWQPDSAARRSDGDCDGGERRRRHATLLGKTDAFPLCAAVAALPSL